MPLPLTAAQVLDREFLEMRARILELAACLDRLQRAEGDVLSDRRVEQLRTALDVLLQEGRTDRAEQVQMLFSRAYDPCWRERYDTASA